MENKKFSLIVLLLIAMTMSNIYKQPTHRTLNTPTTEGIEDTITNSAYQDITIEKAIGEEKTFNYTFAGKNFINLEPGHIGWELYDETVLDSYKQHYPEFFNLESSNKYYEENFSDITSFFTHIRCLFADSETYDNYTGIGKDNFTTLKNTYASYTDISSAISVSYMQLIPNVISIRPWGSGEYFKDSPIYAETKQRWQDKFYKVPSYYMADLEIMQFPTTLNNPILHESVGMTYYQFYEQLAFMVYIQDKNAEIYLKKPVPKEVKSLTSDREIQEYMKLLYYARMLDGEDGKSIKNAYSLIKPVTKADVYAELYKLVERYSKSDWRDTAITKFKFEEPYQIVQYNLGLYEIEAESDEQPETDRPDRE